MMARDLQARVVGAFAHPVIPELVQVIHVALRQKILDRYPYAQGSLPEATVHPSSRDGVGADSGNRWEITFDARGQHVPDARFDEGPKDITGCRNWEIAACTRAPFLCAIERKGVEPRGWSDVIDPIGADLLMWATELCAEFGLEYVDAVELIGWTVPEEILTEEMLFRMDYTKDPNAFQLLFHE